MDNDSNVVIDNKFIAKKIRNSTKLHILKNDVHEIISSNNNYRLFAADYFDETKSVTILCRISVKTKKVTISSNKWTDTSKTSDKHFVVSYKTIANAITKLSGFSIKEEKVHRLDSCSKKFSLFYANYTNKSREYTLFCRINNTSKKTQVSINSWNFSKK